VFARSPNSALSPSRRHGGALVLVLVVLVSSAAMIAASQALLARRNVELDLAAVRVELRAALLMALEVAARDWAADGDLSFDHAGEDWAQARELTFDNGVAVRITPRDAQDRYNLNNLGLPPRPGALRPPEEILAELLIRCGRFGDSRLLAQLKDWIDPDDDGPYEAKWLSSQGRSDRPANRPLVSMAELQAVDPLVADWFRQPGEGPGADRLFEAHFDEEINLLPVPGRQVLPVNLNTARPTVLRVLVGESLSAWVDTVLQARAREPLRQVDFVVDLLPERLRDEIRDAVDVRSDYLEVRLRAFLHNTPMDLRALLYRNAEGKVEVVRCHW